ncbi:MAG TPA: hypothetical protein VGA75_02025 [Paracoccaceae bacterium]
MTAAIPPATPSPARWRPALRRYLVAAALAHLIWEFAHLPLYTIWLTATPGGLVFAALHCTGGDLLITLATISLSLLVFGGGGGWPRIRARRVLVATVAFGVGYTIFSEWLNIEVRQAWAYRDLMPVIPVIGTGLSPVLQWIVIPTAAYFWAIGRWPARR